MGPGGFCLGTDCARLRPAAPGAATLRCPVTELAAGAAGGGWEGRNPGRKGVAGAPARAGGGGGGFCVFGGSFVLGRPVPSPRGAGFGCGTGGWPRAGALPRRGLFRGIRFL